MKVLSSIMARLEEASTYAGLSALCVAISTALAQNGMARYLALLGAVATGVGAIAKADHDPALSDAMDQAVKLVPVMVATLNSVEALLPDGIRSATPLGAPKKVPGIP